MENEKRLIDADALREAVITDYYEHYTRYHDTDQIALIDMVCDDIEEAPTVDAVSRGVHDQVRWERDVAIEQLESYRISLGEKADVVKVVRKPVRGYEGNYAVDQFGRVYGIDRTATVLDNGRIYEKPIAGKQMKQSLHTKGYKTVSLTKDGKTKTVFVHRLVAEAFIDNPKNLPMVNHKDEDKTNNFAENLEWCTASYNRTYGKGAEKQAKQLRGKKHTEEHKQKISESMKAYHGERRTDNA